jgi:hypothetical protein
LPRFIREFAAAFARPIVEGDGESELGQAEQRSTRG